MPQAKKPSKRKHRACAVPLLGAAGLSLSLASGASAIPVGPAGDITLGEEEISDVSLATFYVFDKENPSTPGLQLVRHGGCHRGCHGCGHWLRRLPSRLRRLPSRLRRLPQRLPRLPRLRRLWRLLVVVFRRLQMGLLKVLILSLVAS